MSEPKPLTQRGVKRYFSHLIIFLNKFSFFRGLPGKVGLFLRIILILNIMKEFIKAFMEDYQKENFTKREWIVYGIIAPVVLIALCVISEAITW